MAIPWQLWLANLMVGGAMLVYHAVARTLLPWFGVSATPATDAAFAMAASAATLVFIFLRWPDVADWEEETVAEHTIHQEVWLFRMSWGVGWLLWAIVDVCCSLTWLFYLIGSVGGILLWLYVFDVALEVCRNWDEAWEVITSEPEHAAKMVASSLLILLAGVLLSWWQCGGIRQVDPTVSTPTASYWQTAKEYAKKGWDYLSRQWQSRSQQQEPKQP